MPPSYSREVEFHRALAQLLCDLRIEAHVSQGALSAELGIDQAAVSRVESGQRRLTVAETFSWFEALGLDLGGMSDRLLALWAEHGERPPSLWTEPDA
ncbi:helix-turn-helix domain-containing protein [Arthrobacter silviterrae]|uniref:Helix-turn-helix transcriptional regulator n=1 Tax=Arthrobacter silviterrae TaxID=2026658 RepID=A0ABX0DJG4_9MICC|nr:helix-turn-helix transcriptional regulator [Arthrobacter silviterrae]